MESDKNEIDLNVLNSIDVDSLSKNLKDQNEINFVDINGNIEDNIDNKENMVEDPVELEKMITKEKNGLNSDNKFYIKIHQIHDVGDIIKKVKMTNKIKKAIKKNKKKTKKEEINTENISTSNNIDNAISKNSNISNEN